MFPPPPSCGFLLSPPLPPCLPYKREISTPPDLKSLLSRAMFVPPRFFRPLRHDIFYVCCVTVRLVPQIYILSSVVFSVIVLPHFLLYSRALSRLTDGTLTEKVASGSSSDSSSGAFIIWPFLNLMCCSTHFTLYVQGPPFFLTVEARPLSPPG